jgi:hypothetical protein
MIFDEIDYQSPELVKSTPTPTTNGTSTPKPICTSCPTNMAYNTNSGYCELNLPSHVNIPNVPF